MPEYEGSDYEQVHESVDHQMTIIRNDASAVRISVMHGPGSIEAYNLAASALAQAEIANAFYLAVKELQSLNRGLDAIGEILRDTYLNN